MKRYSVKLVLLLFVIGLFAASSAYALDYTGSQGNAATFETLEETRVSSPTAVQNLETNAGKKYVSHPVLDGYPNGTTYVYRSANLFGGRAAARLNTNILVFAQQSFANKDAALAYLKSLGLIDIIDEAIGSVVLVTPSNGEGFTAVDQKYYYALQTAMLAQKALETTGDTSTYYSDAEYFGGYGYLYVIGLDGGATFLNDYVASTFDYVSRIAGMLLINGNMADIRQVATFVPTYLVGAPDKVIEKYKQANTVDAYSTEGDLEIFFNQAFPLRQVRVAQAANADAASYIREAYYDMFIHAMRVPVGKQGLFSASTPYQGYNFDEAPYSLCVRNPIIDGVTKDGIHLIRKDSDLLFSDIKTENGNYLQTWFEYIPEEVLSGKAPAGSVPMILANHGGGDDPRLFVDEQGYLELAGKERIIIAAPEHQSIGNILGSTLPKLVEYMIETYPAIDASRVYVTGYSMGGAATYRVINEHPSLFAAAAPMAGTISVTTPQEFAQYSANFENVDLPIILTLSTFEKDMRVDPVTGNLTESLQKVLSLYAGFNGLDPIGPYDFKTYPISGFKGDRYDQTVVNGEYKNHIWYLNNTQGVPMFAFNFTEDLIHALYPEYAKIGWNYMKHFSRNLATGEIVYDEFVK